MASIFSDPLALSAYFFLFLAILSLWVAANSAVWLGLLSLATAAAFLSGKITLLGIAGEIGLGLACYGFYRGNLPKKYTMAVGFMILVGSLAIGLHKVPGFKNWLVLSNQFLSSDALPIHFYLNFDKPLIGLFLIGWGYQTIRSGKEWWRVLKSIVPMIGLASLILLGLSFLFGYVKFNPKWLDFSPYWLVSNLVFTCVTEEAFFRGFFQEQASQVFSRWGRTGPLGAWMITSFAFGLAHFPGGWSYVILSTVAGLFYGFAYLETRRLEASILTHFAVNAIHFLFFTYPALKK